MFDHARLAETVSSRCVEALGRTPFVTYFGRFPTPTTIRTTVTDRAHAATASWATSASEIEITSKISASPTSAVDESEKKLYRWLGQIREARDPVTSLGIIPRGTWAEDRSGAASSLRQERRCELSGFMSNLLGDFGPERSRKGDDNPVTPK